MDHFTAFQDQETELGTLKTKVHALMTRLSQKDKELSKFINEDAHKFSKILLYPFENQVKTVKENTFKQEISKLYEEEDTASHIFYVSMVRRLITVDRMKGTVTFNYFP